MTSGFERARLFACSTPCVRQARGLSASASTDFRALAPEDLPGSGRPVLVPAGLTAARELWAPLCRALGLEYREYPELPRERAALRERLRAELAREPALWIAPTSLKLRPEVLGGLGGAAGGFASAATGDDHVDRAWLAERGAPYFGAPGVNSRSVVQFALAALPELLDEPRLLRREVQVGIIGLGRIGRGLAESLTALELPWIFYDPFLPPHPQARNLAEVLAADVVTVHTPLTDDGPHPTNGMIDRAEAEQVRDGAAFLNLARGGVLTPEACARIAQKARACFDVFPVEPPSADEVRAPTLATPHIAGYSFVARAGGVRELARAFLRYLGRDPDEAPPLPRVEFALDVFEAPAIESRLLKADPSRFNARRLFYPPRAGFAAVSARRAQTLAPFHRQLWELGANGDE